ncbi:MAG: hypothetical protein QXR23_08850 [Ignisphaera sp.]
MDITPANIGARYDVIYAKCGDRMANVCTTNMIEGIVRASVRTPLMNLGDILPIISVISMPLFLSSLSVAMNIHLNVLAKPMTNDNINTAIDICATIDIIVTNIGAIAAMDGNATMIEDTTMNVVIDDASIITVARATCGALSTT